MVGEPFSFLDFPAKPSRRPNPSAFTQISSRKLHKRYTFCQPPGLDRGAMTPFGPHDADSRGSASALLSATVVQPLLRAEND